jgi:dTDP-4-amino-4,6-dideoxygalactose transaminase
MSEQNSVPMVDLKAQYLRIREHIDAGIARVVSSTGFIKGEDCGLFEQEFAAWCGAKAACGVANGTDALTLALNAYGVGPGDEVVTVANTFVATGEAVLLNGGTPVWVDVDPVTYTMDPSKLEAAITPRTKVILPVHLYGHPADMEPILEIAGRHGIPVLEDAAQAHGAEVGGKRAGTLGHAACFSFYPGKNLGAYGDAGAVVSNDVGFIDQVRQVANHGSGAEKYSHLVPGTNSRLDTIQAAVLRAKLLHLDAWNRERTERALAYGSALSETSGLVLPTVRPGAKSAWHLYTIRLPGRDGLSAHLKALGIASAVHYPMPLHLQPAMAAGGGRPGQLPVTEQLCREVISLPLYPELPLGTIERIAGAVREFAGAPVHA